MKNLFTVACAAFSLLLALPLPAAAADDYVSGFQSIRGSSVWPVSGTTMTSIEDTFGPRIQFSTGKYDWHRGVDIKAPQGTPVFAVQKGELWKVTTYPDGGLTVILRHTFPTPVHYLGKTLPYYYTLYMHLSSVQPALSTAASKGQHPIVAAGSQIGAVGHTGEANIADHLHLEMRLGTYCSLEFQLQNPKSSCSIGYGFDPAMHALFLFPPQAPAMKLTGVALPTLATNGDILFTSPETQPLLNRVDVTIKNSATGTLVKSFTLDLNQRLGYNAASDVTLDTLDTTKPYLSPVPFGIAATAYTTHLILPSTVFASYLSSSYTRTVTVRDIWNNSSAFSW